LYADPDPEYIDINIARKILLQRGYLPPARHRLIIILIIPCYDLRFMILITFILSPALASHFHFHVA
jgi:hypothetical protein